MYQLMAFHHMICVLYVHCTHWIIQSQTDQQKINSFLCDLNFSQLNIFCESKIVHKRRNGKHTHMRYDHAEVYWNLEKYQMKFVPTYIHQTVWQTHAAQSTLKHTTCMQFLKAFGFYVHFFKKFQTIFDFFHIKLKLCL